MVHGTNADFDEQYVTGMGVTYDVKKYEWNVMESPVFRFLAREHKFALQLVFEKPTESARGHYTAKLSCLEVPHGCHLDSLSVVCSRKECGSTVLEKTRLQRNDMSSVIGIGTSPFPFSASCCDYNYENRAPKQFLISFKFIMDDRFITYSTLWSLASPWFQLSETVTFRAYLHVYVLGAALVGPSLAAPDVNLQIEFQSESNDFLNKLLLKVCCFEDRVTDFFTLSPDIDLAEDAGFPGSPNSGDDSIKIYVGCADSDTLPRKIVHYSTLPNSEIFEAAISKIDLCSDCSLRVSDQLFPAHKAVLCAFPYFQGKFNVDGPETPSITLPFLRPKAVTELIRYLYLRTVKDLDTVAEDLIKVADELLLDDLKLRCADQLKSTLSIENVLSFFVMSDRMQCSSLKHCTKRFLMNHLKEVKSLDEDNWKNFAKGNVELVTELLMNE